MNSGFSDFACRALARVVPPLLVPGSGSSKNSPHKGSAGRVTVVGGSEAYSGAPALAALAALRCGCDLAQVACPPAAATPIKCCSPNLVVRAVADAASALVNIGSAHAVVLGPGAGAGAAEQAWMRECLVLSLQMSSDVPLVVDADGLRVFNSDPTILQRLRAAAQPKSATTDSDADGTELLRAWWQLTRVILTPNQIEYTRLRDAAQAVGLLPTAGMEGTHSGTGDDEAKTAATLQAVADGIGAVIVVKGPVDWMAVPSGASGGGRVLRGECRGGSPRRVGGQGDVFAGVLGTFSAWRLLRVRLALAEAAAAASAASKGGGDGCRREEAQHAALDKLQEDLAAALVGTTMVMREAQAAAFKRKRRGMLATDVLDAIPDAFAATIEPLAASAASAAGHSSL